MEWVGHGLGLVAVALFSASYQIFDKKKLLFVQGLAIAFICLQYLCLGAYSGVLNEAISLCSAVIGIVRYWRKEKRLQTNSVCNLFLYNITFRPDERNTS